MYRFTLRIAALLAAIATPSANCFSADAALISGAVQHPGMHGGDDEGRLAAALLAARPAPDAFLPATLFARQNARLAQVRLKAGVLHDLQTLGEGGDDAFRQLCERLARWIEDMPVTGRVPLMADPRLMQLQPRWNPPILAGDSVRLFPRPSTIQVVGAVAEHCTLPHRPLRSALDYVKDCAATTFADADTILVIQVDGTVQTLGVAAWNRTDPQPVSPGGVVLVPFAPNYIRSVDAEFNADLAALIATQAATP